MTLVTAMRACGLQASEEQVGRMLWMAECSGLAETKGTSHVTTPDLGLGVVCDPSLKDSRGGWSL